MTSRPHAPDRTPFPPARLAATTSGTSAARTAATSPAPAAALRLAGWDAGWDAAWAAVNAPRTGPDGPADLLPGRVTRADRGACDVLVPDPHDPRALATARTTWGPDLAALVAADPAAVPSAGDWVVVATTRWTTEAVLPRRTAVVRAQVARGSSYGQVLAANADLVGVVEGMHPDLDLGRIERLLALGWASGAEPVVLLTKADLVADPAALARQVALLAPGAQVLAVSATTGTGLVPLRERLAEGLTLALVGASGVGKSTLLNALLGQHGGQSEVMATRELRSDGKGRHTTVTRELHLGPGGGAVLDTPGLRTIGLLGAENVDEVFGEVEELARSCRFRDCEHRTEPGCAVLAAVEAGRLPERRLTSYRKLLREVEYQASRVDARVRATRAGRWRAVQREARRRGNRP